ncbi:hypothetical protein JQX13_53565 [Archangium violaceum]|uniref:hypothetical protein n=1 Tax=Archangium violaceum TaxID=83451 RepID=UPI00193B11A3|nr:hypothetical protein JQX13_53565 [Archangium violaceum]
MERLGERLGADGIGQLARYIQASREAALLVCEGGEAAAVALHEARGDVARAQAWLSEAKPPRTGPTPARASATRDGGGSSLKWGNSKSTPTYGHTFSEHGAQNTKGLIGEAGGTGKPQGQWLNNDAAAKFLAEQRPNINGPTTVNIPEGLGRVVNPDGSFSPATRAILVPSANGGFRTAYPIL